MEPHAEYLRRRAREERAAAAEAPEGKVRDLHLELAARYLKAAGESARLDAGASDRGDRLSIVPDDFRIIR